MCQLIELNWQQNNEFRQWTRMDYARLQKLQLSSLRGKVHRFCRESMAGKDYRKNGRNTQTVWKAQNGMRGVVACRSLNCNQVQPKCNRSFRHTNSQHLWPQ
jgi:hypothetical protein